MNKFSMKEKVVVSKGVVGEVKQIERTTMFYEDGKKVSTYKYLVQYGEPKDNTKNWYTEGFLRNYLNDEISVNKALINVNLLYNLELAKQLKYENDQLEASKVEKD